MATRDELERIRTNSDRVLKNKKDEETKVASPSTVFRQTEGSDMADNGLMIMYVPKDASQLYVPKEKKNDSKVKSAPRSRIPGQLAGIDKNSNNRTGSFLSANDVAVSKSNNQHIEPTVSEENSKQADIQLYLQMTRFSLPEVLKFGKKATGQTTDIPGGKRQTQITGVFPKQMAYEVIFYDRFAQEHMAVLELFTGQRTVLFYQETHTNLKVEGETTKQGEEVKTYAWLGTVMDVEFEYYHRHYIVAKIIFEPLKDIRKARITQESPVVIEALPFATQVAKSSSVEDNFPLELKDIESITSLKEKEIQDGKRNTKKPDYFNLINGCKISETRGYNSEANVAQILIELSKINPSLSIFNDMLDWLNTKYIPIFSKVNNLINDLFNGTTKIKNIIADAQNFISAVLDPIDSIGTNLLNTIRNAGGLLDLGYIPYRFLNSVQSKLDASFRAISDLSGYLVTKFGDISNMTTQVLANDNITETNISESSLKDLTKVINSAAGIGFLDENKVFGNILDTINNLKDSGIDDISYFRLEKIKAQLNNILIPLEMKNIKIDKINEIESKKQEEPLLNPRDNSYENKLSPGQAEMLKFKEIFEKAAENKVPNAPLDAILAQNIAKIEVKENIEEKDVKVLTEIALRTKVVSILQGMQNNKEEENMSLVISSILLSSSRQIPYENKLIQKHIVNFEDIRKGGYNAIALKYYGNPQRGVKLEKYNNRLKLNIGVEINIPQEIILLTFDKE